MNKQTAILAIVLAVFAGFAVGLLTQFPARGPAPSGQVGLEHPVKGSKSALITIYEISDFECPYCGKAALENLPAVQKMYGDKVAVQFHHNPLGFHKQALPASKASVAAGLQGRFWEMHDLLFRNRKTLGPDKYVAFAQQLGLDVDRFQWDMNDPRVEQFIKADMAAVAGLGLKGTPMFIINGKVIQGAQPPEKFKEIIDEELKKAEEALAGGTPRDQLTEVLSKANAPDGRFIKYFVQGAATKQALEKKKVDSAVADEVVWKVPVDKTDDAIGPADAPLTIVVFSDFECPFSARATAAQQQILEEFGDEVRLVFKHFPLPFHKNAVMASKAVMAAGKQGRFWEMHDLVFENSKGLTEATIQTLAGKLKLDPEQFQKDLQSEAFQNVIDAHMEQGGEAGVRSTPNTFFNGRMVKGAQPFDTLRPLVLEELAKGRLMKKNGVPAPYEKMVADGRVFSPISDVVLDIKTEGSPSKGDGNELEIVIFSEFQCPYCRRVKPTLDNLLKLFKGRARLVFKHFPLGRHDKAHLAAQATMAANAQGKFWEMHDRLFQKNAPLSKEALTGYAQELGLDVERFSQELDHGVWKQAVDNDLAEGKRLGVRGTPTIFFNGRKYMGASRTPGAIAKDIDKHVLGR